jgi:hypothetical protein
LCLNGSFGLRRKKQSFVSEKNDAWKEKRFAQSMMTSINATAENDFPYHHCTMSLSFLGDGFITISATIHVSPFLPIGARSTARPETIQPCARVRCNRLRRRIGDGSLRSTRLHRPGLLPFQPFASVTGPTSG